MQILLLRHAQTRGNALQRYIGRTDDGLSEEGIRQAHECAAKWAPFWKDMQVYVSPLRRCLETCAICFPAHKPIQVPDFRECDFGSFENRSAAEMADDPAYQKWLRGGCLDAPPQGEDPSFFKRRTTEAFAQVLAAHPDEARLACVMHGGSIMAILERFEVSRRNFYEYRIQNCTPLYCQLTSRSPLQIKIEGEE